MKSQAAIVSLKVEGACAVKCRKVPESGKGKAQGSPPSPEAPAHKVAWAQLGPCWTSDLWNCKELYCVKILCDSSQQRPGGLTRVIFRLCVGLHS